MPVPPKPFQSHFVSLPHKNFWVKDRLCFENKSYKSMYIVQYVQLYMIQLPTYKCI